MRMSALLLVSALVLAGCGLGRRLEPPPTWNPAAASPRVAAPAPSAPDASPLTPASTASRWGISIGAKQLDPRAARAVGAAAELGPIWFRMSCGWAWVEATPGRYDWRLCDEHVRLVREAGFSVLFILGSANHLWNTAAPADVTEPARREQYPPADWASYERFVGDLVRHYRGDVSHWEVRNEPDLRGYWRGTAAEYARMLSTTYDAIKRADPQATVVFGGLSLGGTPGALDTAFLEKVLDDPSYPGVTKFDVMNYHHYGSRAEAQRRYEYVRGEMRERGIGRPVWVTELGASSSERGSTPETQAAYMRVMGAYLFSLGVERVFWFELLDGRQARDGTFVPERSFVDYGLLDRELRKKPAFEALRQLAR